jgi:RNA polymerase sigma factor (sigma-70 family)
MKSKLETLKTRPAANGSLRGRKSAKGAGTQREELQGQGSVLSLMDLEIPSKRLLTRSEERSLGQKIQSGFRRLKQVLPETLYGYRRYLQQMAEMHAGSAVSTAWFPLRDRMGDDILAATKQLEISSRLGPKSAKRAETAILQGVQILKQYRLDPETRFQWSRQAAASPPDSGPLDELERPQKALKILKRTVKIMEEARDRLVLPNFRLILKEAFRYQPVGMKRSDLFQEGILGLHRAVFRFDPTRLTRFSTYATYWIRQAIRKALIDRSRLIRVPQAVQEELRNPETHLSKEEVQRVNRIMRETVSISSGDEDDEERRPFDMLGDRGVPVSEKLHTGAIPTAVSHAMVSLDAREREVIRRRFGLEGEQVQTLEEIGSSLHLSRERIRQIEAEALKKMGRNQNLQDVYDTLEAEGSTMN